MTKRVNTIQTLPAGFPSVNLSSWDSQFLLFALYMSEVKYLLTEVWHRHCPPERYELRRKPHISIRICLAIHLGYNRQQIALLVGNGWTIRVNAFIRMGYAIPNNDYIPEKWEELVLSDKGLKVLEDLFATLDKHINGLEQPIPWPEYKKRGLNKRLAPKQKENK
jgi:hypothetical protein